MNIKLLIVTSLMFSLFGFAQQGDGGIPHSAQLSLNLKQLNNQVFERPDIETLKEEDKINDETKEGPWRFGFNNNTNLNINNSGTWLDLPNGDKIWMIVLTCKEALTVNLTLDNVLLPEGNELYIFNKDRSFVLGKFTEYHLYEGQLGSELIPGESAIVEYFVPAANLSLPMGLNINTVTHGYRTSQEYQEKAFGSSGSCNMNVNCPDGAPWVNQRNSAILIVAGGNGHCSAALVNNTLNDGKPYVLTANHCLGNPASWVFRFNWEAPTCSNPGVSPSFESLSGSVLRASRVSSDFALVEITGGLVGGTVPCTVNPFFAGWDNSGFAPDSSLSIHHPSGDIKKIAFDDDPAFATTAMSSEANGVWEVHWDRNTTTEGGSSGSPLFNQYGNIIGQLWGGSASCGNQTAPDFYGRISNSWNPTGSINSNQLKNWLDPNETNRDFQLGYRPCSPESLPAIDPAINNLQGAFGTLCSDEVNPLISLSNYGSTTLTSATINYGYNGVLDQNFNWTGNLEYGHITTITLPTFNTASGSYTFVAEITNPNGSTDQNLTNNNISSDFTVNASSVEVIMNLIIDCYGSETTWELRDEQTNALLHSGGPYGNFDAGLKQNTFCLEDDKCYRYTVYDSFNDGMSSVQCENGSYTVTDGEGTILIELLQADANFGSSISKTFCLGDFSSLKELDQNNVSIYPNPANTTFNYTSATAVDNIEIYNVAGQLVLNEKTNAASGEMNIAELESGVYMVRFHFGGNLTTKRLIIK